MNVAYNMDCMEYMKTLPDNAFDLAVVDPPYGAGLAENGGCKGWVTKYRQDDRSQSLNVEREREDGQRGTDLVNGSTDTRYVKRALWHGKDKYHLGELTTKKS